MALIFLRRTGIVLILFALFAPIRATAGPVYLAVVVDPITTAGAGVPTIPRQFNAFGTGSFSVTSTKSGIGTWHLYALDDVAGSLGIAGFSVSVGNSTGILNRSPTATYTNYGDLDEEVIENTGSAGFSDPLVRSGVGVNPANPIQGNQVIGSLQDIAGFGQTAGNLNNTPNNPAPGDHRVWGGTTSGQWGNYATAPIPINGKSWLFLGEGNYSGPPSFANVLINHYDSANPLHQTTLGSGSIQTVGTFCVLTENCNVPRPNSVDADFVNANNPGLLNLTMSLQQPATPNTWNSFRFDSYVPAGGASGTGPATLPTFNTTTGEFSWNTVGSPLGTYKWWINAGNFYGSNTASITVHVTAVPEPATLLLLAFALAALCIGNRHRR